MGNQHKQWPLREARAITSPALRGLAFQGACGSAWANLVGHDEAESSKQQTSMSDGQPTVVDLPARDSLRGLGENSSVAREPSSVIQVNWDLRSPVALRLHLPWSTYVLSNARDPEARMGAHSPDFPPMQ